MVRYSHNVHTTIAPGNVSHWDGHYCSSQGLKLDKAVDYFYPPVVCVVPPSTLKNTE